MYQSVLDKSVSVLATNRLGQKHLKALNKWEQWQLQKALNESYSYAPDYAGNISNKSSKYWLTERY